MTLDLMLDIQTFTFVIVPMEWWLERAACKLDYLDLILTQVAPKIIFFL
jgi:hypothetical protein